LSQIYLLHSTTNADWIYVGELPESININPKSEEELETKLDLALGMLSLAHRWEIAELHLSLQDFIINKQHFINPYSVRDSKYSFLAFLIATEVGSSRARREGEGEQTVRSLQRV